MKMTEIEMCLLILTEYHIRKQRNTKPVSDLRWQLAWQRAQSALLDNRPSLDKDPYYRHFFTE